MAASETFPERGDDGPNEPVRSANGSSTPVSGGRRTARAGGASVSSRIRPLHAGYSVEFAACDEPRWRTLLEGFEDANLYQTWTYDGVRQGERNLCHCVVSRSGRVVAAAQARVLQLAPLPAGAAYVRWGPLWRRADALPDPGDLRMALRALRNELVLRRGLFLRVFPLAFESDDVDYSSILHEEGFTPSPGEVPQRTLLVSLQPSLEETRKNFDHKWRNCLSKAERNGLVYSAGSDDRFFHAFMELYRALLHRKQFKEPNDINEFREMQRRLPDSLKMMVFLTGAGDDPSCGGVCTAIGATGVYLFGACNDAGLKTNGSYLIQWKAIQWLKEQGCRWYNLNGVNPDANPGTYHFKAGIAGKSGLDTRYLGRFDAYAGSATATIVSAANRAALSARRAVARARSLARRRTAGAFSTSASS